MTDSSEDAATTLDFCYTHLNYPGAKEFAKTIREKYFTDDVFRPFPGIHPEILGLFSGYRTRNGRPVLQFYVTDLISDGLVGIYLLGINNRHFEVRVLGFKDDGSVLLIPRGFRSKLTNLGTELPEAKISDITEEEFWSTSTEMGVPMFNFDQGQMVLMDRNDAPRLSIRHFETLTPWYNLITRQPLDPSRTREGPFDWFESDMKYHTYFASHIQNSSRMSPKEIAAHLWENGRAVIPPTNSGAVREGLGLILGPFNVEDIWNNSNLRPLINDLDIPKIH